MPSQAVLELLIQLKDQASSGLSSLGDTLKTVGGIAGGAALAGIGALGAGIAAGVGDAREAAQVMAQTENVIRSTGQAAGVTADHVADYAASLSAASGQSLFGDDQIQQSTNLLLTFTNIKDKTLDAATAISVDMAQALGGAPKDAAIQLGKALNDPINGVTALSRVGVSFTDEQKEQIKTMQEAGDTAGAQAVILGELNKEFGGSAKAAAAADGGFAQFQDTLGETFETIGASLLPTLNQLGAFLSKPETQAAIAQFADALATGITVAADFLVTKLIPAVTDLYNWLAPRLGPILTEVGRALTEDLPRGVAIAITAWDDLKTAVANFKETYIDPIIRGWEFVSGAASDAWDAMKPIRDGLSSIQIPAWLQGHSPPPMADWFQYIADAAANAQDALPTFSAGGAPALAAVGAGAGSGLAIGTVNITISGASGDARALALEIRDELLRIQRNNGTTGIA